MNTSKTKEKRRDEVLLGKYELGGLLGRGTFSKVYYAKSLTDGGSVAVKVLDKPEVIGSGMAPQILREVSAMRRLSHPNIVRLHEVMATRSKIYLIMDYVRGGELFARIARRGRLPESAARKYFQQLAGALRFCHARGVSHRDVKPQNLLLDRDGNLKVTDFGLSALPEQLRNGLLHTACGTPAYAAPEVVRRKGYDGAKADAWSCGVILFVLLAGSLPFDDSNLALMYRKMHKREYEFPAWFPQLAKRIVYRLLDPSPETRLTIEGVMELPWFKRSLSIDSQLCLLESVAPSYETLGAPPISRSPSMNAFEIISLSKGLDLSGLFDEGSKREQRFTSTAPVGRILEKIGEAGGKLGYTLQRRKEGAVGMGKWGSMLTVEVLEVASPLLLVALKVDVGGGGGSASDSEEFGWGDLKEELSDVVSNWHNHEEDS